MIASLVPPWHRLSFTNPASLFRMRPTDYLWHQRDPDAITLIFNAPISSLSRSRSPSSISHAKRIQQRHSTGSKFTIHSSRLLSSLPWPRFVNVPFDQNPTDIYYPLKAFHRHLCRPIPTQFAIRISASNECQPIKHLRNVDFNHDDRRTSTQPTTVHLAPLFCSRPLFWHQPWHRSRTQEIGRLPGLLTTPTSFSCQQQIRNDIWTNFVSFSHNCVYIPDFEQKILLNFKTLFVPFLCNHTLVRTGSWGILHSQRILYISVRVCLCVQWHDIFELAWELNMRSKH